MKKPYSKPQIAVEALQLDQPIAAGCMANKEDMNSLIELGYFGDEKCTIREDQIVWGDDTICYHSNVQIAFLS
ncbi:MAG: hypothetical protein ACI3V4_04945 [Faecousia sp.]